MNEHEVTERILRVLRKAKEPLTTAEIVKAVGLPRHIVIKRLFKLAVEGRIRGKQTKTRGSWIWWYGGE